MRIATEEKLAEAKRYFFSYEFRKAYHLYHQAFSLLPFQMTQSHFEHIGYYVRTLLEVDRLGELRFYVTVLENHYEKQRDPYVGYTLAYMRYQLGLEPRETAVRYLREVCENPASDSDLRIKAKMILARMHEDTGRLIEEIRSIREVPRDPILANLLKVWQCYVLQHQERNRESVESLTRLIATLPPEDWYSQLSAKDILIRGYLKLKDFHAARREINGLPAILGGRGSRTATMHLAELNETYRRALARERVLFSESRSTTLLRYDCHTSRISHPRLRRLIHVLHRHPTVTRGKILRGLELSEPSLRDVLNRFTEKMRVLSLPEDSVRWEKSRLEFVPRLVPASGGTL